MATPHKITLVPYLQAWDHASRTLRVRLLLAPTGNPLDALSPGEPAFADAKLAFQASISDAVDALPQRVNVDETETWPAASTVAAPDARTIFGAIKTALSIPDSAAADTFAPRARDLTVQIRKYLPHSYRRSFAFVQPRTELAVIDDTYHCAMRCPPEATPPLAPTVIGWGEALAFALRRPRLAEALGLIHEITLTLDAAPRLEHGGWLWFDLAAASDFAAAAGSTTGYTRSFATRVPPLDPTESRALFTPVVFPVFDTAAAAAAAGNFDKVFVEALRFDDGFSKVVHARQPLSADVLDEEGSGPPIPRDEGVQLAWDDEDILEGQNRSLGAPPAGEDPVIAPRGVLGYRVDVRNAGESAWHSLSRVNAPLVVGVDLGTEEEERWTEVVPTANAEQLWLPAWFAKWRGASLVVDTNDEQRLMEVPPGRPVPEVPLGADDVPLRYGQRYEFRVRLADTTGGGPDIDDVPSRPGESPIGRLHFKRWRRPGRLHIRPFAVGADGRTDRIRLQRPLLGYPEAMFAAGPSVRPTLLAQIASNDADPANATPAGIRDVDVAFARIRVSVKAPTYDPAADEDGYVHWYETGRAFPSDPEQTLDVELVWQDIPDLDAHDVSAQLGADGTITGPVLVPTARDVRIEVRAAGRDDLTYFGDAQARLGESDTIDVHARASLVAEQDVLAPLPASDMLRSIYLRPDPTGVRADVRPVVAQNDPSSVLLGRLAEAADLVADGDLLVGRSGERVAFGCSGLTHHAAPDLTSLEMAEPSELSGQWLNVAQAVIARDWTWRGAGTPAVKVIRSVSNPMQPSLPAQVTEVGRIELMPTINVQARQNPERTYMRLIFIDALPPPLDVTGFPHEVEISYTFKLAIEDGGEVTQTVDSVLPIVTPPRQVPKVVAAGVALTPYERDAEYDETGPRTKRLWIEFDEPLADPRDAYFARALTRSPDPMLLPNAEPLADPDVVESIPIDPELVRVITPGQVQDLAGLASMQKLEPAADSDRRFLLPLPPNTDPSSPDLFSFFTYEFRVGHDRGPVDDPLWTTAQGRFGQPLLLEGVQHPAPELRCTTLVRPHGAVALLAPYATPYVGLRQAGADPSNTEMWFVLYARVMQADGSTRRNIQIGLRRAARIPRSDGSSVSRLPMAGTGWTRPEVEDALASAGLPRESPLSALAVELLPEPNGTFSDPLGAQLGNVRILRTSPLAAVDHDCC